MKSGGNPGFLAKVNRAVSEGFLHKGAQGIGWVGGLGVIVLMAVSIISIIGRRVPAIAGPWLIGVKEYSELTMALVVGLSVAFCWYIGGHLRIDLLRAHWRPRAQTIGDVVGAIFGMVFAGVVAWAIWGLGMTSLKINATTRLAGIPEGPFRIAFVILMAHFFLVLLRSLIGFILKASGHHVEHDGLY